MSDSKLTPPTDVSAMSLRECRLIVERLLVAAGAPAGLVPSARDAAVAAEIAGLGVLRAVYDDPDLIVPDAAPRVRVEASPRGVRAAADGILSLYAAPAVRDLLLELEPGTPVTVTGVTHPEWLGGVALTPGLEAVAVQGDGDAVTLALATDPATIAARAAAVRARIEHAQHIGLDADADLWFGLYVRSNGALAQESAISRAHAGYRDVDATGRIVKQMDDDTDLEHALQTARS